MTCRTGLGLLVLTTGLTFGSVALADDNPEPVEKAAEKAKTSDGTDKARDKAKADDKKADDKKAAK